MPRKCAEAKDHLDPLPEAQTRHLKYELAGLVKLGQNLAILGFAARAGGDVSYLAGGNPIRITPLLVRNEIDDPANATEDCISFFSIRPQCPKIGNALHFAD